MSNTDVDAEMPRYKCHKEVHALKIKGVVEPIVRTTGFRQLTRVLIGLDSQTDGSRMIIPEDQGYAPFRVDRDYVRKHNPQPGGYYVVYNDGYKSFSPAKAFEEGYTRV